ncbi:MAG TPA: BtpA/SgcQ family protein [Thermomicrobiales bacterium]|nr:BtpA/SgcQ family protein [Thermomicrobiales bacterium]HRA48594.1 BtpA/SgcQ family protein [Thermomicrobiales bacterium]
MTNTAWPRIVGVLHLPPLPGAAKGGAASSMRGLIDAMLRDAQLYADAGIDTVIVENYGDLPFVRDRVDAAVTAAMTMTVDAVQRTTGQTVGVNVLRNDVVTAVSIAAMTGARFVRANVYVGVMQTESGIIQGCAHAVQQEMKRLGAPDIEIWADLDVKHATPLVPRSVEEQADDAIERAFASALILTGPATGAAADPVAVQRLRDHAPHAPIYVGSGANPTTIPTMPGATGFIVGTAMKVDGCVTNPVDPARVRAVLAAAKQ